MTWDKRGNLRGPAGPAGVAGAPGKAFAIRGPYNDATYYKSGDVVTYEGRAWVVDDDRQSPFFNVVANADGSFDVTWNYTSTDYQNEYFYLEYTGDGRAWNDSFDAHFYQESDGQPDPVHVDPFPDPINKKPIYFRASLVPYGSNIEPLQVTKIMDARYADPDPTISYIGTPALPENRGAGWLMVADRGAPGEQGPAGDVGPLLYDLNGAVYSDQTLYRSDYPVAAVYHQGSTYALRPSGGQFYSNAINDAGLTIIVNFFTQGVADATGWEWDWTDIYDSPHWTRQASVPKPANGTSAQRTFSAVAGHGNSAVWVRTRLVRSNGTKTDWRVQTVIPTAFQGNPDIDFYYGLAGTPAAKSPEWTLVAAGGLPGAAGAAGPAGAAGVDGVKGDTFYGFTVDKVTAIASVTTIAPGSGTVIQFDKFDSWFFASAGATLTWSTTRPSHGVLTAELPNYQWVDQQITASLLAFSSAQKTAADLSTQLLLMGV